MQFRMDASGPHPASNHGTGRERAWGCKESLRHGSVRAVRYYAITSSTPTLWFIRLFE